MASSHRATFHTPNLYAKIDGSVAAPTAGLHFTDSVLDKLHEKNISTTEITLHVGAGTFKPVTTNNILEHQMHEEFFQIDKNELEIINKYQNKIIAVS